MTPTDHTSAAYRQQVQRVLNALTDAQFKLEPATQNAGLLLPGMQTRQHAAQPPGQPSRDEQRVTTGLTFHVTLDGERSGAYYSNPRTFTLDQTLMERYYYPRVTSALLTAGIPVTSVHPGMPGGPYQPGLALIIETDLPDPFSPNRAHDTPDGPLTTDDVLRLAQQDLQLLVPTLPPGSSTLARICQTLRAVAVALGETPTQAALNGTQPVRVIRPTVMITDTDTTQTITANVPVNILTFDTTTNLHAVTLDGHLGALFTDVVTPRPDACYHAAVAHAGPALIQEG